jgi:putative membrane-bound dehydrogenase-like protein
MAEQAMELNMMDRIRPALVLAIAFSFAGVMTAATLVPADSFVLPEGMEVTVWATSPLLHNPTNIDIDHRGRVWVAQGRNYRMFRNADVLGADSAGDSIVVLEDTDQDGKADKRHVFVQEAALVAPLGVAVIDNKVVVSQPPSIIVYTDVDRNLVFDPKVDTREELLTGFGGRDHDHSLHSVTTGPNGQWYFNVGNAGTHNVTDKAGWTLRVGSSYNGGSPSVTDPGPNQGGRPGLKSDDGHVYVGSVVLRVNPDGTGLRPIGHNMRNSYEQTVTSFGDVFQNDNDDPPACRTTWLMEYGNLGYASDDGARKWGVERRPGQPAAIAEWRQEDPGTIPAGDVYGTGSPTGIAFYENGALGPQYEGLLLSCEAAVNVVFGYLPKPQGAGFALERFDFMRAKRGDEFADGGREKAELANWFRPSDVCVGVDGAIYVADWFDPGVGGHRMQDKSASGTIYRIAPKGRKLSIPNPDISKIGGQVNTLRSPANNVRNMGFTRLKAAGAQALPQVKRLLTEDDSRYIHARAVFLLAQLGDEGIREVEKVLRDSADPQMRIAAFRALRAVEHQVLAHAATLAKDPSPAVRREVALALRDVPLARSQAIILELARGYDGQDRWYLEALGTACANQEAAIYPLLLRELGAAEGTRWDARFTGIAWRLHPAAAVDGFKARALHADFPLQERERALTALGFIPTREAALAMVEVTETGPEDLRALAAWWLGNRGKHMWSEFTSLMKGLNKKTGLQKADRDFKAPIDGPVVTTLDVKEILALEGDASRGQTTIARCYMCHQVGGMGVDFGPPLDGWGKGNSREAIANAIVHPGAGIAHGFEASEIETRDGHIIQGFVLFAGGSYIVKVFGGQEVSIPRGRIKRVSTMENSLMMSAGKLGLSAQDVADVVAYLKGNPPAKSAAPPTPKPQDKKKDPLLNPFANPVDDPALPRVLIVGDSISIGYTTRVRKHLAGKANVHRAPTNCRWSAFGNEHIGEWIGEGKWDVIHFNFGLWDWYGWAQDVKATPESYAASLEGIVRQLKATGAELIFGVTTPPCIGPERKVKIVVSEARAKAFNDAALAVMQRHGVAINDLYAVIGKERERYQRGENDVHYNEDGRDLLGAQVARAIRAKLPVTK